MPIQGVLDVGLGTFTHHQFYLLEVVPVEALDGQFLPRRFFEVRCEILKHLLADLSLRVFGPVFWDARFIHARCPFRSHAGSHSRFAKGVGFTVRKSKPIVQGLKNRQILFTRPCVRVEDFLTCLVTDKSGEVNGWGLLEAREEHEAAKARDQVFCTVSTESLTDLRFRVRVRVRM